MDLRLLKSLLKYSARDTRTGQITGVKDFYSDVKVERETYKNSRRLAANWCLLDESPLKERS